MRRLMEQELREIGPVALVVGLGGLWIGCMVAYDDSHSLPEVGLLCCGLGTALGITQGIVDRRRRDDPFLLHRPVAPVRIHAARGCVGAAVAAATGAVTMAVPSAVAWLREGTDHAALHSPGWSAATWVEPDFSQSVTCVAATVVFHAVARLAMAPRSPLATALLVVSLPLMTLYALLSIGTESAPWLAFAAVAGVAASLDAVELARRPA